VSSQNLSPRAQTSKSKVTKIEKTEKAKEKKRKIYQGGSKQAKVNSNITEGHYRRKRNRCKKAN